MMILVLFFFLEKVQFKICENELSFSPSQKTHKFFSANAFQSTSDKPESRSATLAGNCTVSSMEYLQMARCPAIAPSESPTMLSTLSSPKRARASTCHGRYSAIWSQLSSMRFAEGTIKISFIRSK